MFACYFVDYVDNSMHMHGTGRLFIILPAKGFEIGHTFFVF